MALIGEAGTHGVMDMEIKPGTPSSAYEQRSVEVQKG